MPKVGVFASIFDENNRILCVKRAYSPFNWTTPGGRMEAGESPLLALEREVLEETGYVVRAGQLIGIYSTPSTDDLVLSLRADILHREAWQPNGEISELGFFPLDGLPQPLRPRTLTRITHAFEGRSGVLHVFPPD